MRGTRHNPKVNNTPATATSTRPASHAQPTYRQRLAFSLQRPAKALEGTGPLDRIRVGGGRGGVGVGEGFHQAHLGPGAPPFQLALLLFQLGILSHGKRNEAGKEGEKGGGA